MTILAILLGLLAVVAALAGRQAGPHRSKITILVCILIAGTFFCAIQARKPRDISKKFADIPLSCGMGLGRLIAELNISGEITVVRFANVQADTVRIEGLKDALAKTDLKVSYIHEVPVEQDKGTFSMQDLEDALAQNPGASILVSMAGLPSTPPKSTAWPKVFAYSSSLYDGKKAWLKAGAATAVVIPRPDGTTPPLDGKSPEEIFADYFTVLK